MFIVHLALQGCLRAEDVAYGLTPDTGGHIRYLLELATAQIRHPAIDRVVIVTRAFESRYGADYHAGHERTEAGFEILRLPTSHSGYLSKEDLWRETDAFSEALAAWLEAEPKRPDYLHAHYADAATVAARMRERFAMPFVFTAHSLGRVKLAAFDTANAPLQAKAGLERRVVTEENAISAADLVVASSRDEAEVQYATYDRYEAGRIRIIEPGSNLEAYRAARPTPAVRAMLAPFLREPDRPMVLAIARPMAKKNLPALVEAFGSDPWLYENANLVLVAGVRDDIADLEPECREEMRAILEAIDRHDLYGRVALPKHHGAADIPALYALAHETGGVFVNPALNEPFGLTLLEAAASGLPVVATDSGGPNDIVERCRNGLLVSPQRKDAIATACRTILADHEAWRHYSANGAKAVAAYDWDRHTERCLAAMRRLLAKGDGRRTGRIKQLLVSDIDNTLTGSDPYMAAFVKWYAGETGLTFAVATGRSFHSALAILEQHEAPTPEIVISSVGSEIHLLDENGVTYHADRAWERHIDRDWHPRDIAERLACVANLAPQGPLEQRRFKLSYLAEDDPGIVERIRGRLGEAGLAASVIYSHARYLDILPVRASKGAAIAYLRKQFDLAENAVFVAGDSGNDIEMLQSVPQAIIVANYSDSLASNRTLAHSYIARKSHALGIIEGVRHFRERAR
ncbi:HAD-IIB family hydrolase [Pararhizobium mangrovi]|uniref:sucrose-phosphate synthase n=1 Tax=Pararhizobium mangrovi TaxID=2590452 RepID=A0A506U8G4_9HYPH|nr:HAD-IIB family hydrolase [Pararhizobium mangrovi]TPW28167.1 HAD-IIB family hydrolase [Pararhizobium mangrovi]